MKKYVILFSSGIVLAALLVFVLAGCWWALLYFLLISLLTYKICYGLEKFR